MFSLTKKEKKKRAEATVVEVGGGVCFRGRGETIKVPKGKKIMNICVSVYE